MKRMICLLFAVCLLLGMFSLSVAAQSETLETTVTTADTVGDAEAPSEDDAPSGIMTALQNVVLPGALFLVALVAGYLLGKKYTKKK